MTKTLYGVRARKKGGGGRPLPHIPSLLCLFPLLQPHPVQCCLSLPPLIVACRQPPLLLALSSPPLPLQILILKVNSVSRRCRDKRGEKSALALWIQGWNFLLYPSDVTISLLVTLNPPMYGHPVRPTLRRNKGHWIIAQTAPLSRLAAASWMYAEFIGFPFALPHFPSCFCNGFPLVGGGIGIGIGQLLSLSLFIPLPSFPAL